MQWVYPDRSTCLHVPVMRLVGSPTLPAQAGSRRPASPPPRVFRHRPFAITTPRPRPFAGGRALAPVWRSS